MSRQQHPVDGAVVDDQREATHPAIPRSFIAATVSAQAAFGLFHGRRQTVRPALARGEFDAAADLGQAHRPQRSAARLQRVCRAHCSGHVAARHGVLQRLHVLGRLGQVSGGKLGDEAVVATDRIAQLGDDVVVENRCLTAHCVTPDGARPSAAASSAGRMGLLT